MQNLGSFDASTVPPEQGGSKHPVGNFPFEITNTDIVSTKDGKGGMFAVTFTSPAGQIINNYNLWNQSDKAVEIARKQLSALCHAVGIFKLNFDNKGRELVGGRGTMKVNWQKGQEPSAEHPNGGYVEVEKVFDANGNEPGKPSAQPQPQNAFNAPQQQAAPMQQQPGGGWGNPNPAPAAAPAPAPQAGQQGQAGGWNAPTQQPQQGFQQQPNGGNPPPWGNRS